MAKKLKSKITSILMIAVMLMTTSTPISATENPEKLILDASIGNNSAIEAGEQLTLTVKTGDTTKLSSCDLLLTYDENQMEVISGKTLTTSGIPSLNTDGTDNVIFSCMAGVEPVKPGNLFEVTFKVKDTVKGVLDISLVKDTYDVFTGDISQGDYSTGDATPEIINNASNITVKLPPTDISALKALIEKAEAYNADDYTADSFDVLTTALTAAKAITDQNTKEEVAQAQNALQLAIDGLKKAVDKSALQAAVDQIPDDMSIYTPETAAKVEEAKNDAQVYLEDKNLEDTEENRAAVQAAADKLLEAIKGLEALPQKDVLAQRITEAEAKLADSTQYMTADVQALQAAVDAAKVVNDNENATEADVSKALGDLDKALSGLRIKADKAAYDAAVAEVKGTFSEEAYTTSSWKGYVDALTKAEALSSKMASEEVAQVDADAALTALQNASKALIPVASEETKAALQAAIESAEQVNAANFTEESYAKVDEALKTAKALDLKDTSDETVKAVTQALNNAVQALVTVAKDEKTGVVVEGLEEGATIEVTDKTDDKSAVAEVETAIKNDTAFKGSETQDVLFIADITPSVASAGTVTLKIPVANEKIYDEYYVGHKNEDGTFTWVKVAVKDGIATLSVDSFSEYTVIGVNWPDNTGNGAGGNETNSTGQSTNNGGNGNVGTGIATESTVVVIAGLLILAAAGLVVYRKKFNN